jgi:hypothetical protein
VDGGKTNKAVAAKRRMIATNTITVTTFAVKSHVHNNFFMLVLLLLEKVYIYFFEGETEPCS